MYSSSTIWIHLTFGRINLEVVVIKCSIAVNTIVVHSLHCAVLGLTMSSLPGMKCFDFTNKLPLFDIQVYLRCSRRTPSSNMFSQPWPKPSSVASSSSLWQEQPAWYSWPLWDLLMLVKTYQACFACFSTHRSNFNSTLHQFYCIVNILYFHVHFVPWKL